MLKAAFTSVWHVFKTDCIIYYVNHNKQIKKKSKFRLIWLAVRYDYMALNIILWKMQVLLRFFYFETI